MSNMSLILDKIFWMISPKTVKINVDRGLTIKEEIALVERMLSLHNPMKISQIADALGATQTYVAQTAGFRKNLSRKAFASLLNGKLKRCVAVCLCTYTRKEQDEILKSGL